MFSWNLRESEDESLEIKDYRDVCVDISFRIERAWFLKSQATGDGGHMFVESERIST